MVVFLAGACGALAVIVVFACGVLCGWKTSRYVETLKQRKADPASEEEKEKLRAEQQAFHSVQNYSAETAYGITPDMLRHDIEA